MLFIKLIIFFFLTCLAVSSASHRYESVSGCEGLSPVVKKDQREVLVSTEFGQISAVNVSDGIGGHYHLQFITLEPNALFLPVVLHADMVFYVHTGSGSLSWSEVEADTTKSVDLQTGDVYGLPTGSIFYLQSGLEPERTKLRIYAMFVNSNEPAFQEQILPVGTYSSIRNLLLGFDRKVLQAAFQASDEAMEELMNAEKLPQIVHATLSKKEEKKKGKGKKNSIESRFMEVLMDSSRNYRMMLNFNEEMDNKMGKKKKKEKGTFSFMNADHDFENCNGWSVAVTSKNMPSLRSPDVGLFMVNLTRGAMMGPHWNPLATELGIVVHGQGMILTVSSSDGKRESCRIKVEEGDVFVVPRFSMMAQLAFNNDSLVFMGFSTSARMNHPQYSAGKASVLQVLDRKVLALSFNVTNSTMDQILNPSVESIILECGSCAEEEERIMYEEIRKEEEAAAARKREEEEAARKREEEEEAARKREEEEAAARKREEEEKEARKREEEKEARKREEEEEARKREEEEARKREEEEEARKREEEASKREEEEEARKGKEEEEREEEEEARKREEEEEEARKRKEEQEAARKQEEEAARKQEEEAAKQEEEAARRQEEEQEEAAMRQEEEAEKRREKEKEAKREEEEESRRREEEEAVRREEEKAAKRREQEEEEARRIEEEEKAARRIEKEEKAKRVEEEEEARKEEKEAKQEEEEEERYDQE